MWSFAEIAIDGFIWQREDGFAAKFCKYWSNISSRLTLMLILLMNDDDALITNVLIEIQWSQNKNGEKYGDAILDQLDGGGEDEYI